jgi:glycosyltransferase involved in cell wall biosynthesis
VTGIQTDRDQVDLLAVIDHFGMGGAETLLTRFAVAAPRVGIRPTIVCLTELDHNPAAEPLHALGIPPVNLDLPPGRPPISALLKLRRHIATSRPQIVHTHLGTSDVLGALAARSLGVPMVSTIHAVDWNRDDRRQHAMRMLVKLCAARVIAVSESARRHYIAQGWGREQQVVTIHNGMDVTPEPGSGQQVRRELGLDDDALVIGMVSALRPEKAHDLAIRAVALLRDRVQNVRLLIAGQGERTHDIARLAAQLNGGAVMAGRRSDVMRVFDAIDICLHPSRADAFPTTLIEAMAASVPVLATSVGGIPEIIIDGVTGVLMPASPSPALIASQLNALIEAPARRAELGAAGRFAYERRFTADPWVASTRAVYDQVLAERSGSVYRRRGLDNALVGILPRHD